jgi:hypothetical protein
VETLGLSGRFREDEHPIVAVWYVSVFWYVKWYVCPTITYDNRTVGMLADGMNEKMEWFVLKYWNCINSRG